VMSPCRRHGEDGRNGRGGDGSNLHVDTEVPVGDRGTVTTTPNYL
jgi:hypothetical protein